MTQEEKAKAYDEALERAKTFYENANANGLILKKWWVEQVFPELKESEDERIRKAMIEMVHDTTGDELWVDYNVHKEDALAWLEKEGEQKPADKVEPKFHEGDWISGYYTNYKVLSVNNEGYVVEDVDGNKINILFENEKFHHLWTIQDAKDGDVLYLQKDGKEHIIIYKGIIKERFRTFVSAYCAYNGIVDAFCFADVSRYVDIAYRGIISATKEQRDTLFAKMKESGYEWDAKKKELKKIEQKQVTDYPNSLPKDNWELIREFITKFGRIPKDEDELNVLVQYVLKRQKPAWSEEDEAKINRIVACLENLNVADNDILLKDVDWLKSLKDRVQPQTHHAWSEDDEQMLNHIICDIESLREQVYCKTLCNEEITWLKSLRPQSQWRPSDE